MFAVCDHEIVMVIGAMLSNFLQNHLSTSVQTQKEWIVGFMVGGELPWQRTNRCKVLQLSSSVELESRQED